MRMTDWNWVVWCRAGSHWYSLPFTAHTTRALSIYSWKKWMGNSFEWRRQRRAGDVRCVRTKFEAQIEGGSSG